MTTSAATQKVKIAVDSPSDLPPAWREKWKIAMIPCFVNFGTEGFPDDGVSLTRAEFYRRLAEAKTLPTTSAPPSETAEEILRGHLADTEQVIVFTVAQQFSSLYNSIRLAAGRVDPERVTVVDSGSVSMGYGWQALAAAEVAARGGSKEEVLAAAQSTRERISFYAAIDTLEYLRRGGRVSSMVASIGALLQIKPILQVHEGKAETANRVRTMGKGLQALVDLTRQNAPIERIAILHSNAPQLAEQLKGQLADLLPTEAIDNVMTSDVTTAIGTHIGPGCAGVIAVKKGS
jgi:DegV family protein with EDD domain